MANEKKDYSAEISDAKSKIASQQSQIDEAQGEVNKLKAQISLLETARTNICNAKQNIVNELAYENRIFDYDNLEVTVSWSNFWNGSVVHREYMWRGTKRNDFMDFDYQDFKTTAQVYYDNLDDIADAINNKINQLNTQKAEHEGIIGKCWAAIDNLGRQIENWTS